MVTSSEVRVPTTSVSLMIRERGKHLGTLIEDGALDAANQGKLGAVLLNLIADHTSAQIDRLTPDSGTVELIATMTIELSTRWRMISISELVEAFKLASSGILKVDMATYYGKFSLPMLGQILSAYRKLRSKTLSTFDKRLELMQARKPNPELAAALNPAAQQIAIDEYKRLSAAFAQSGDTSIIEKQQYKFARWAPLLIKRGVISIDSQKKKQLWTEAKKRAHTYFSGNNKAQALLHSRGELKSAMRYTQAVIDEDLASQEKYRDGKAQSDACFLIEYGKLVVLEGITSNTGFKPLTQRYVRDCWNKMILSLAKSDGLTVLYRTKPIIAQASPKPTVWIPCEEEDLDLLSGHLERLFNVFLGYFGRKIDIEIKPDRQGATEEFIYELAFKPESETKTQS